MDERTQKVIAAAGAERSQWALLTAPDSVAYAARHVAGVETGPSPFDGGPTAALISPEGEISVLCNELEAAAARSSDADHVFTYESLGFADLRHLTQKYAEGLGQMLDRTNVKGAIAVEAANCPASVMAAIGGRARIRWFDVELGRARSIKTPQEIAALRHCAELTAAGQDAVAAAVTEGKSELFAWRDIRFAMEEAEGTRLPVAGDFVSGVARTAAIGGPATGRTLAHGDPIISDLAPRARGYWGDSCRTACLGEASPALMQAYDLAYECYQMVRDTLRPGITAHEFDAPIRQRIKDAGYFNPVHMGHGVGTSVHEWPRLVPGEQALIQPGMVLMVEPGVYREDIGGVRLEQMFLITETGHEVLSPFDIPAQMPII